MSGISTHVLDTSLGRPAARVPVRLEAQTSDGAWQEIGQGTTDAGGRVAQLLPAGMLLAEGTYRLRFDTAAYFGLLDAPVFYPEVIVVLRVSDSGQHYHIPLLLAPFGYSTYRGS